MYGLAYVILRNDYSSLQEELVLSLAPFMRGGDNEFPREQLAFNSTTANLKEWIAENSPQLE